MAIPGGRKLRPLAIVCALLMVLWGLASAASLVMQILNHNEFGWPDEDAPGEVIAYTWLFLAAAASGCWVGIWGLFGLAWRPPLHFGAISLVVAVALEIAANLVLTSYLTDLGTGRSFGDQMEFYLDRATFQVEGLEGEYETRGFFIALPLVTAVFPLIAYLVTLFTGAGRKRRSPSYGATAQQPQHHPQHQPQHQPQHPPQHPQPSYQPPAPQPGQQRPAPQQPAYPPPPNQPTRRLPPDPSERP